LKDNNKIEKDYNYDPENIMVAGVSEELIIKQ
jgi:hypothetical protein